MKGSVLFLNRFYWPDVAATAQILTDLAEDLAERGWSVSVVASRTMYEAHDHDLPVNEVRNGVTIHRVRTLKVGRHTFFGRISGYASYMVSSLFRLLTMKKPEIVVAMSDPPMMLALVLFAARVRGIKVVHWVQDVYPQLAATLGALQERGPLYRTLRAVAWRMNAAADLVVALGPRMADRLIAFGAPRDRVTWVHNWADSAALQSVEAAANPFIQTHQLQGRFLVTYSGNAGRAHTFSSVLTAARELAPDGDIVFLFIGGGARFEELRSTARDSGFQNMRFLGYVPREQLRYSLSAASVSLVTENPEVSGLLVPSKTYGILASGRPVIYVGPANSDVAQILHDYDCGVVVPPDDPEALVAAIRKFRNDPSYRERLGRNARAAAETVFDRSIAAAQWSDKLAQLRTPGQQQYSARAELAAGAGSSI